MLAWLERVELGGEGEVALAVVGGGGDGFLGAVLVRAGCVAFRVAGGLEVVEEEVEFGEGGGFGAPFDVLGWGLVGGWCLAFRTLFHLGGCIYNSREGGVSTGPKVMTEYVLAGGK